MDQHRTVEEILKSVNERLPRDEEIIKVYTKSRSLVSVNAMLVDLYLAITEIDDSRARNAQIYRKKKRLEYFCNQLQKRAKYLENVKLKQALRNKAIKKTAQDMRDMISQGLLNYVIKSSNVKIARNTLQDLRMVKQDLAINARNIESDAEFKRQIQYYLDQGMELKDALKQVSRDLKAPHYQEPIDDISQFNPNSLNLEPLTEEQKQVKFEDLNLGQSKLMQEPLSTEFNPIRLKKEPQKDLEEGA